MEDTIASIQRDESHLPFMLERLYNQVCSKCVDGVLDLSSNRGALNDLGSQGPGSALDTLLAVLATARALRRRLFAEPRAALVEPPPSHSPTCERLHCAHCHLHRPATFTDPPPLPTHRPRLRLPPHYPCRRFRRRTSKCAEPSVRLRPIASG